MYKLVALYLKVVLLLAIIVSQGRPQPVEEVVAPVPVYCAEGMTPVQNKFPITSNGCTGSDFIDLVGEEDFTSCCDEHDACYQVCGMTKKRCDMKFWECMEHMCVTMFTLNKDCRSAANIYYIATKTLGRTFYEDAQSEHCMCIDSGGVSDYYHGLIENFYSTYAPKSKAKFDWTKYEHFSWPKLAALYNTLHEKYHKAITHEGPRAGKNPPRSKTRPPKKIDPWGDKPHPNFKPQKLEPISKEL